MGKPKTITIREHVAELDRREREWGRQNVRQTALDYATRNRREFDTAKTLVESAKAFEAYLNGKSR